LSRLKVLIIRPTSPTAKMRSIVMNAFVCLSVHWHISNHQPNFTNFLRMLTVAVSRSLSGSAAIRYVLPVLWMPSLFTL